MDKALQVARCAFHLPLGRNARKESEVGGNGDYREPIHFEGFLYFETSPNEDVVCC